MLPHCLFAILASQNIHFYVDVQQNSVNPNDIAYGVIFIVLSSLLILLSVIFIYYSESDIIDYFIYFIIFGFIATLMVTGIKYILSGEFA